MERYGYDTRHKLVSRTDRAGGVFLQLYDEAGRWTGTVDAEGHANQVVYDATSRTATLFDSKRSPCPVVIPERA